MEGNYLINHKRICFTKWDFCNSYFQNNTKHLILEDREDTKMYQFPPGNVLE